MKNKNVVLYLTGNKEKDEAIKKYCHKEKLKIMGEFKPNMLEAEDCWNSGITNLYNGIIDLKKECYIDQVITYDLDNLFWCTYDQVAIVLMLFDICPSVFTLKEGELCEDGVIDIKVNIKKDNIELLKKYWTKDDIKRVNTEKK